MTKICRDILPLLIKTHTRSRAWFNQTVTILNSKQKSLNFNKIFHPVLPAPLPTSTAVLWGWWPVGPAGWPPTSCLGNRQIQMHKSRKIIYQIEMQKSEDKIHNRRFGIPQSSALNLIFCKLIWTIGQGDSVSFYDNIFTELSWHDFTYRSSMFLFVFLACDDNCHGAQLTAHHMLMSSQAIVNPRVLLTSDPAVIPHCCHHVLFLSRATVIAC